MARLPTVHVESPVLVWALESSGLSTRAIAERLKVPDSEVSLWLSKQNVPLGRLRRIASACKRPLAVFLLAKPPPEPSLPADFRGLSAKGPLSPQLRIAIRQARWLRSIAIGLSEAMEEPLGEQIAPRRIRPDDPVGSAQSARLESGVSLGTQKSWKDAYEALRVWRDALEKRGFLVFQTRLDPKEAKGFSIEPNIIVVNSAYAPAARIFTIFHEYGHLLRNLGGICFPEESELKRRVQAPERWCDEFAAAFLLPPESKGDLALQAELQSLVRGADDRYQSLGRFARRYKVSREMLLRRLISMGLLQDESLLRELKGMPVPTPTKGGVVSPVARCISEKGYRFTSLVVRAMEREAITPSDAADYLGIGAKHLDALESMVG